MCMSCTKTTIGGKSSSTSGKKGYSKVQVSSTSGGMANTYGKPKIRFSAKSR